MIFDIFCSECGAVTEDVILPASSDGVAHECPRCGGTTWHDILCNGGAHKRYRFNDFSTDPLFYSGQVSSTAPTATHEGRSVTNRQGRELSVNEDKRASRRDKIECEYKIKTGRNRIYSDGG